MHIFQSQSVELHYLEEVLSHPPKDEKDLASLSLYLIVFWFSSLIFTSIKKKLKEMEN